jgi:hypothetical protein
MKRPVFLSTFYFKVSGLSPLKPIHVGFVVDKVSVGRISLLVLRFFSPMAVRIYLYKVGHEKVVCLLFAFVFGYCINFCIYAMLRTRATFSWPILYNDLITCRWRNNLLVFFVRFIDIPLGALCFSHPLAMKVTPVTTCSHAFCVITVCVCR